MSDDTIIRVEGLCKRYGLPLPRFLARGKAWLREFGNHAADRPPAKPSPHDKPWALEDVSFEMKRGETLGIIGRNGAGKSTLLKVLAGVTPATQGSVKISGRLFPMIELNAGIHSELTGRENVRLLGAIMGLTRMEVDSFLPAIEEFCELGEWFDRPVRTYSSGMLARLGFGVAMNVDADVLLVDEVLAVGDLAFQRKSLDSMERLQENGKTLLFVSHSLRQVERLCSRTLLLDKGRQIALGSTTDVLSQYYESTNSRIVEQHLASGEKVRLFQNTMENAVVDIMAIRLLDEKGNGQTSFSTGQSLTLEVEYLAHETVGNAIVSLSISTIDLFHISGFSTEKVTSAMTLQGHGKFRCTVRSLPLLTGIYTVQSKIKNKNGAMIGGGSSLALFSVTVPGEQRISSDYGVVMLDVEWHLPVKIDG